VAKDKKGEGKRPRTVSVSSGDRSKQRRSDSWNRNKIRAHARYEAQHVREAANRALRASGDPTPWEAACVARNTARRPLQDAYALAVNRERHRS
jgi:hypothetical protein